MAFNPSLEKTGTLKKLGGMDMRPSITLPYLPLKGSYKNCRTQNEEKELV